MNALVGLALVPVRNSLILIGLAFRTFSVVISLCLTPFAGFVHEALPIRSPSNAAGPEVTLKVALTLAPGATESNVCDVSVVARTKELHCLLGTEMLSFTPLVHERLRIPCWTFTPSVSEGNRVRLPIRSAANWSSEIVLRKPPLPGCGADVRKQLSAGWPPSTSGFQTPLKTVKSLRCTSSISR